MKKNKKDCIKLPEWKEKTKKEKVLSLVCLILSIIVIVLCFLDIFNRISKTGIIYEPMLAIILLLEALMYKKYDKQTFLFLLISSIIMLVLHGAAFLV